MTSPSLTRYLQSIKTLSPYTAATQHDFLRQAGDGTLPHDRLALWLAQDRIYAREAYPRFIGSLLSLLPLTASPISTASSANTAPKSSSSFQVANQPQALPSQLQDRILKILVFSLENVVREVNFFGETARKWGLDLECWKERKGTRDYTAEMVRVVQPGSSFEDGLVFLWAMERVRSTS
jgi:formylaminopyrimidine deformylase / aminopyrimidine aminohydrolase